MMKRRKRGATVAVGIAFTLAFGIGAGCSPQVEAVTNSEEDQASGYTAADAGGWEEANERGCGSCHENLWETLGRMDLAHLGAARYLPVDFEVQQCIDCHMKEEDAGFGV